MLDLLCAILIFKHNHAVISWCIYTGGHPESWRTTTSQSKRMLKVRTHKPYKNHTTAITLSCEKNIKKKKKHSLVCAMTANLSHYDIQCSVRSSMMLFPWNPRKPFSMLF